LVAAHLRLHHPRAELLRFSSARTRRIVLKRVKTAAVVLVCFQGCAAPPLSQSPAPPRLDDGWDVAAPRHVQIDEGTVATLVRELAAGASPNVHSVLLARNGKLVVEAYFPGEDSSGRQRQFNRETLHEQHSVSKSVTGILVGIAIDQSLIAGPGARLATFFPDMRSLSGDAIKSAITLRDCLTMTAGLDWDEWRLPYTDRRNVLVAMNQSADPFRYVLDRPAVARPGAEFAYNGGLSLVLSEVVRRVSAMHADEFAERYLFAPLGITVWSWERLHGGTLNAGGGLQLRPRDMAKMGQLVFDGGRWHGTQIVSSDWIRESTEPRVRNLPSPFNWLMRPGLWIARNAGWIVQNANGYGYHWWHRTLHARGRRFSAYSAEGRGGQLVIVVPDLRLVAVFTGWNDTLRSSPIRIFEQRILPAVGGG
jgi:CubicO group peptidase (beta-lactamase class C family)